MTIPTYIAQRSVLTLPHHFRRLQSNIEPPQDRKDLAASLPGDVREFLGQSTSFLTISPHTRLTGSYARYTAIHGIKDVDFVVFVGSENCECPDPVEVLDALYATLKMLPDFLGKDGSAQVLRKQRRSVHVSLSEWDFHLDVVPVWMSESLEAPLLVPDKEWSRWVTTDPLGYGRALSELNSETSDKAIPLIKLFKHWRTVQMVRMRPKSFWLEVLTYHLLRDGTVEVDGKSSAELFTDLICAIKDAFQPYLDTGTVPVIRDPMLPTNNIAFNWEFDPFKAFMIRLSESIGWAQRALAKSRDDMDEAIVLWQRVFGAEYFVDSPDIRKLQQTEWRAASPTLFVGIDGNVMDRRPDDQPVVISRPHRFYGDPR